MADEISGANAPEQELSELLQLRREKLFKLQLLTCS